VRLAAPMDARPKRRAAGDRERNAEALRRVPAESEQLLRRQARRHSELPEDAEDALQSAYLLFIERYRSDCDPLAWLYTTVKREAWALWRRSSRRREVSLDGAGDAEDEGQPWIEALPTDGPAPDERAVREEELAARQRLIADLKPDQRRALVLLAIGLSYAEIQAVTGWTYTKVNRCIAEGRADLRSRDANPDEMRQTR
jgi:RNA polymerase sigma factor (sigma-70 family)